MGGLVSHQGHSVRGSGVRRRYLAHRRCGLFERAPTLGRRTAGGEAGGETQGGHEARDTAAVSPSGAQALGWFASLVALVGYGLVLAFPGRGWALLPWAVSNPVLVVLNLRAGLPWQALLFAVYTLGTLWGLWRWWR